MNRKFLIAGGLAGVLTASGGASAVFADWCADDPAIQVGPNEVVYLTNQADSSHLASLEAVRYRVLGTQQLSDGLHVTLLVYVPTDASGNSFDVQYTVSSGPDGSGNVLASGDTESGNIVIVHFVVPS